MSPLKLGRCTKLAPSGPLDGQFHVGVDRGQGGAGVLVLHHQARHLPEGRHGPAGQHGRGDDAAHGHVALGQFVNADDDHRDVDELLHELGEVDRARREQLEAAADLGDEQGGALPLALDQAFGAESLDRLEPHQAFHQGGVALGAGPVGGLGELVHLVLSHQGDKQHGEHADQRRQQQPGRDPHHHQQEQQYEGQVDEGGDGG
jgi:hypothetical protein